jgi:hypothetical protein
MKKAIIALAAMATIVVASIGDAEAQRRYRNNSGAAAAGIIGGLAAGAIIGGAIANSRPAYAEPVYVVPRTCVTDQEIWSERRQAFIVRRVRVPC